MRNRDNNMDENTSNTSPNVPVEVAVDDDEKTVSNGMSEVNTSTTNVNTGNVDTELTDTTEIRINKVNVGMTSDKIRDEDEDEEEKQENVGNGRTRDGKEATRSTTPTPTPTHTPTPTTSKLNHILHGISNRQKIAILASGLVSGGLFTSLSILLNWGPGLAVLFNLTPSVGFTIATAVVIGLLSTIFGAGIAYACCWASGKITLPSLSISSYDPVTEDNLEMPPPRPFNPDTTNAKLLESDHLGNDSRTETVESSI